MKKRTLGIAVMIIVMSWGLNLIFFQSRQLSEPILFPTYSKGPHDIELLYLTNKQDPKNIDAVSFGENRILYMAEQNGRGSDNQDLDILQKFSHHVLAKGTLEVGKSRENSFSYIGESTIHLKGGTSFASNIGGIVNEPSQLRGEVPFRVQIQSSNSHAREFSSVIAKEALSINGIEFAFPSLEDDFRIKVDVIPASEVASTGEEPRWVEAEQYADWKEVKGRAVHNATFPLEVEKGESIKWVIEPKRPLSYTYDFPITYKGTKANGTEFENAFQIQHHRIDPKIIAKAIEEGTS